MGRRALRTSALIVETAREVFLQKGYFGTTIDDIADAAGLSRSSFYTYFPSKRDVLLVLGNQTYQAMDELMDQLMAVAEERTPDAVERIVTMYLRLLDEHGAFLQVWGQAGFGDETLRRTGMRAKLSSARRLAAVLRALGWEPEDGEAALTALALAVMMDRFWFYEKVAGLPATDAEMVATLSSIVSATIGRSPARERPERRSRPS
jgi:AcrR family transcriptional regulator